MRAHRRHRGGRAEPAPGISYTQRAELPASGRDGALSLLARATVPPGRYTLRVGAMRDGRLGSVDARVHSVGPLMVGDIVLNGAASGAGRPAPSIDGVVSGPRLTCALQVAGDAAAVASATFVLEVARTETGEAFVSVPARAGAAAQNPPVVEPRRISARSVRATTGRGSA